MAQRFAPAINPFLIGPLARYAALDADMIAAAMVAHVRRTSPGIYVHHVPAIRALSRS